MEERILIFLHFLSSEPRDLWSYTASTDYIWYSHFLPTKGVFYKIAVNFCQTASGSTRIEKFYRLGFRTSQGNDNFFFRARIKMMETDVIFFISFVHSNIGNLWRWENGDLLVLHAWDCHIVRDDELRTLTNYQVDNSNNNNRWYNKYKNQDQWDHNLWLISKQLRSLQLFEKTKYSFLK